MVGVDDHDSELLRTPRGGEGLLERRRSIEELAVFLHARVDRRQHVLAVDAHAVANDIDDRHIRARRASLEAVKQIVQQIEARVDDLIDFPKAEISKRLSDRLGVRRRGAGVVAELIGAVSDHQRHPLLGGRGRKPNETKKYCET